jgi:hypothetical protein
MQTVACDSVPMSAKEFIAPWSAVTADNVNLKIRIPERGCQVVKEVEYAGIVLMNFASAVVAQITVQASQGLGVVACSIAVNDVQSFSSVCVNQMQLVRTARNRL